MHLVTSYGQLITLTPGARGECVTQATLSPQHAASYRTEYSYYYGHLEYYQSHWWSWSSIPPHIFKTIAKASIKISKELLGLVSLWFKGCFGVY